MFNDIGHVGLCSVCASLVVKYKFLHNKKKGIVHHGRLGRENFMPKFAKSALLTLAAVFLIGPSAHAQTPLDECMVQAELNIAAVEAYIEDPEVQYMATGCWRQPKGGFAMYIYTDCKLGKWPDDYNGIIIKSDKIQGSCDTLGFVQGVCAAAPPGVVRVTRNLSNKELAAVKRVYRRRCADWEPPTP